MADMTKAFLQISVADKDRDTLRFLQFTGPLDAEDTKSCTLSITCVLFKMSSSPFMLAAIIKKQNYQEIPDIKDNLYFDDFIASLSDV